MAKKDSNKVYEILRPTLRFCKGDKVRLDFLRTYFTDFCIDELIEYGYLKFIYYDV